MAQMSAILGELKKEDLHAERVSKCEYRFNNNNPKTQIRQIKQMKLLQLSMTAQAF
jgi:hypothetical protein